VDELNADDLLDACLVRMTAMSRGERWEESEKWKRDFAREVATGTGRGNRYWLRLSNRRLKAELTRLDKEARRFAEEVEEIEILRFVGEDGVALGRKPKPKAPYKPAKRSEGKVESTITKFPKREVILPGAVLTPPTPPSTIEFGMDPAQGLSSASLADFSFYPQRRIMEEMGELFRRPPSPSLPLPPFLLDHLPNNNAPGSVETPPLAPPEFQLGSNEVPPDEAQVGSNEVPPDELPAGTNQVPSDEAQAGTVQVESLGGLNEGPPEEIEHHGSEVAGAPLPREVAVNGKMTFVCPIVTCKKSFAQHKSYRRHYNSTHNNQVFNCVYCNFFTSRRDSVNRHVASFHPPTA